MPSLKIFLERYLCGGASNICVGVRKIFVRGCKWHFGGLCWRCSRLVALFSSPEQKKGLYKVSKTFSSLSHSHPHSTCVIELTYLLAPIYCPSKKNLLLTIQKTSFAHPKTFLLSILSCSSRIRNGLSLSVDIFSDIIGARRDLEKFVSSQWFSAELKVTFKENLAPGVSFLEDKMNARVDSVKLSLPLRWVFISIET